MDDLLADDIGTGLRCLVRAKMLIQRLQEVRARSGFVLAVVLLDVVREVGGDEEGAPFTKR